VFQSTDGGGTWTQSLLENVSVHALAVDPAFPSTVYAGTLGANIFKSTDRGLSWVSLEGRLPNSFIQALAIDPANSSTVYAGGIVVGDGFVLKLNAAGSTLMSSTYLGGDDADSCNGIAVDDLGAVYLTGTTYSKNVPVAGMFQRSATGSADAFVAKLNLSESTIAYAIYLGGSGRDEGRGIAVDSQGNAYVTGFTFSTDFPIVAPLPGSLGDINGNAFVAKVDPFGTGFVFSSYLGGVSVGSSYDYDAGLGIAVDPAGNAYVTGETVSERFPTTPGAFQTVGAGFFNLEAFVSKLSPFDVCLQDESNGGSFVQVNSSSGDFVFYCSGSIVASGRGTVQVKGYVGTLEFQKGNRRVSIRWDFSAQGGKGSGTAMIQSGQNFSCQILDRDMSNSTCNSPPASSESGGTPQKRGRTTVN
jgi:hypothetical protein